MDVLSSSDREQILSHGIEPKAVLSQLETFARGFPFVELVRPCTLNDGIVSIQESQKKSYDELCEKARLEGRCRVFVPASGAASRMFKAL